ncbi:proton-conducting transporter membrane subunit [Escherichia coli]|nr:proton-conducting transporter membrane subunit [Escherichia coli]
MYLAAATLFLQTGTFALSAMSEITRRRTLSGLWWHPVCRVGKSAQLPMQAWLPDAMEAPTPISAYLHAASMVKVGVYIFARAIIDGGNIPHVIGGVGMVMALVTILYGFLMYLPQQDMKRLLAWSTITQLGWMFSACRSPSSARGWRWRAASPTSSTTRSLKAYFPCSRCAELQLRHALVAASAWRIAHPAVARRGFLRGSAGDYRRTAVQRLLQ